MNKYKFKEEAIWTSKLDKITSKWRDQTTRAYSKRQKKLDSDDDDEYNV